VNGRRILVVAELEDGSASGSTRELLALGRDLAGAAGTVVAVCLDAEAPADLVEEVIASGADIVIAVDDPLLEPYQADAWLPVLADIVREQASDVVLMSHSLIGADLAPRLAFRLDTTVATGCVDIDREGDAIRFVRPCYGGNARETLSFLTAPAVATIKAKAFDPLVPDLGRTGTVVRRPSSLAAELIRARVTDREVLPASGPRLESARVIVSGGRGIGGPDGFQDARRLADLLGGAVGASRAACDLGWCPHTWQIGLSGKTVAPDVYIALGISGAGQHMAGCGNAKTIVAINSDPDADIFKSARFGVVGDCRALLPALIDAVGKLKT
jgi:electron transfer flavoprotein alpha subunit